MNMKIGTASLLALAIASTAAPAHADWETTRWGMSPEEALSALDGASAHDPASNDVYEEGGQRYIPRVVMPHEVEGVAGRVSLLFDTADTLRFVAFAPNDRSDCEALRAGLSKRYGEGEVLENSIMSITDWTAGGDAIKLFNSPRLKICTLSQTLA